MIPALYFPTTVVCIDDDELSLSTYKLLFQDIFNCVYFNNGKDALEYISSNKSQLTNLNFINHVEDYDVTYNRTKETLLKLNIAPLLKFYSNELKSKEISVVLTDYQMNPINGIKLCHEVRELPLKKFLLTESKDQSLASTAYNTKIINYFLNKTVPPDMIITGIKLLIKDYFIDVTNKLMQLFEVSNLPLMDKKFINNFEDIIESNKIIEYYLIDKNGSFLLIDSNGMKKVLLVHTDSSLENFLSSIDGISNIESAVEKISNRSHLPFMGIVDSINYEHVKEIEKHLVSCYELDGQVKYYIGLIDIK